MPGGGGTFDFGTSQFRPNQLLTVYKMIEGHMNSRALGRLIRCAAVLWIAMAVSGHAKPEGHRFMPSDVMQIKVFNQPDLDTQARVEEDGTIIFPFLGRISVTGLSEDEVSKRIEAALEKADVVKKPQVLVTVVNFGGQISVQGAVATPGIFVLDRPTTIVQALSRAGGLKDSAGNTVVIQRKGRKGVTVTQYDLQALFSGETSERNLTVQNNDNLFVAEAPVYYLWGFVKSAGRYPLKSELNVQQALAAGGGISDLGSEWRIEIRRRLPTGEIVEGPVSLDDRVLPNDTVVVNERWF